MKGFGAGNAWGSLGGVIDVDQDTYISAENSAGTDNDQLKFFTADSERMIIDASGNVGIGTTTPDPSANLDVSGSIRAGYHTNTTSFFGRAAVGYCGFNNTAAFSHLDFNDTDNYALIQNSAGNTYINTTSGGKISFRVNNLTHMILQSDGNIGIGTDDPSEKLDVSGNIKLNGSLFAGTTEITTNKLGYLSTISSDIQDQIDTIGKWSNGSDNKIYYNSGTIGIGTTDPSSNYKLDVGGGSFLDDVLIKNDKRIFFMLDSSTTNGLQINSTTVTGRADMNLILDSRPNDAYEGIHFRTNGDNRMVLNNTGQLGIGTFIGTNASNSPQVILDISGTDAIRIPKGTTAERPYADAVEHTGYIRYNSELNQFEGFGAGNAWGSLGGVIDIDQDTKILAEATPDEDNLRFYTAGSERMIINNIGNVGIGISSPATGAHLDVSGNIQLTGSLFSRINGTNTNTEINLTQLGYLSGITANKIIDWTTDHASEVIHANNLPTASSSTLGGIMVGSGLSINSGGTLSSVWTEASNKATYSTVAVGNVGYGTDFAGFSHTNPGVNDYALLHKNDGQTMINSAVDKPIIFRENNVDKMSLLNGKLGIGTDSPSEKLVIGKSTDASDNYIKIHTAGTYKSGIKYLGGGGNIWSTYHNGGSNTSNISNTFNIGMTSGDPVVHSDFLTINGIGNVGIGTYAEAVSNSSISDEHKKLEIIDGNLVLTKCAYFVNTEDVAYADAASEGQKISFHRGGNNNQISIPDCEIVSYNYGYPNPSGGGFAGGIGIFTRQSNTSKERLRIDLAGNVGIGTTDPSANLHICSGPNSAGNCKLIIEADTDDSEGNEMNARPSILFRQDGGNDWSAIGATFNNGIDNSYNNALVLSNSISGGKGGIMFATGSSSDGYTAAEPRMLIDGDGNVGIGTTSPSASLEVSGNLYMNNGSANSSNNGTVSGGKLIFNSAGHDGVGPNKICLAGDNSYWGFGVKAYTLKYHSYSIHEFWASQARNTDGSMNMRISATGKVEIPGTLDIGGDNYSDASGSLTINNFNGNQVIQRWSCKTDAGTIRSLDLITPNSSDNSAPFIFNTGNAYRF